jgi:hypothetical protein
MVEYIFMCVCLSVCVCLYKAHFKNNFHSFHGEIQKLSYLYVTFQRKEISEIYILKDI